MPKMYARPTDRVADGVAALNLLAEVSFAHLVSVDRHDLKATSIPFLVDGDAGLVVGHLARANDHWQSLDGANALLIATPSDGYVSPSWYPSKPESGGKVVPTWNYEAIHVHGRTRVHEDPEWLLDVVTRLTDHHEASRTDGGEPWAISDAPPEFIQAQLRAIIGVSLTIDRIEAKQKLSGNRPVEDQAGVLEGLERTAQVSPRLLKAMTEKAESANE